MTVRRGGCEGGCPAQGRAERLPGGGVCDWAFRLMEPRAESIARPPPPVIPRIDYRTGRRRSCPGAEWRPHVAPPKADRRRHPSLRRASISVASPWRLHIRPTSAIQDQLIEPTQHTEISRT